MTRSARKVTFKGAHGHALAGRLDLPEAAPRAFALFAHCFSCSKDVFAAARVSASLADHGIAVLRFDFTGLGHSEGDFANTNFSSNVEDLVAAATFLRDAFEAPGILIGHSFGGAAVLMAAGSVPEAKAVVTIAAPSDPAHVQTQFAGHITEIEEKGIAEVNLAGRPFTITRQFLDDIRSAKPLEAAAKLKKALLILHSPRDETVSIENASAIFLKAKHPKSFVSLDDADHLLTRKRDALYVGELVSAWASRYVGEEPAHETAAAVREGVVIVEEAGRGKYANLVRVGRHLLHADEPLEAGGTDTGPSPYGYLTAALGACTSMTLRMYADRKEWPLDHVAVTLRHEKKHAEDCEECKDKLDHIYRTIRVEGDLDDAQRARLLEIADKCPVHRTLTSRIVIDTKLA